MFKNNKRGVIAIYLVFMAMAVLVILVAAVLAPMGVMLNTKFYEVGEQLMLDSQATLAEINDSVVRAQINASIQEGLDDLQTNIDINADIFQYGWVIAVILVTLVVFLFTRRTVEVGGGGGLV
jgi:sensor domain CHASE-containing protein